MAHKAAGNKDFRSTRRWETPRLARSADGDNPAPFDEAVNAGTYDGRKTRFMFDGGGVESPRLVSLTSEKLEISCLVEQSHLPVRRTLEKLGILPARSYCWYDRF